MPAVAARPHGGIELYYLVSRENACGEAVPGTDGNGASRPEHVPIPGQRCAATLFESRAWVQCETAVAGIGPGSTPGPSQVTASN